MFKTRNLLLLLALGCVVFVLFAFTIAGLMGEALVVLSVAGLLARAVAMAAHRLRQS